MVRVKPAFINGLTQSEKDTDFHIIPTITFARRPKEFTSDFNGFALGLTWGHWTTGFIFYWT